MLRSISAKDMNEWEAYFTLKQRYEEEAQEEAKRQQGNERSEESETEIPRTMGR